MDEGTHGDTVPLSGNIEPAGDGEWLGYHEAARREGVKYKAIYRRVDRRPSLGRTNPETGEQEIWIPRKREPSSPAEKIEENEERSPAVPDQEGLFLVLLDRATASLGRQVQELTEEREQARRERDEERQQATAARALAEERAVALAKVPGWLRKLFGVT